MALRCVAIGAYNDPSDALVSLRGCSGSPLTDHEARQIFDEIDAAFGTRRRDTREGSFRPGVTLEGMLSATSPTASAGDTDGNADDTAAK